MKRRVIMKTMSVLLLAGISLASRGATAGERFSPDMAFYQANSAYERGDYEEALELYGSITERGYASGELFYNIGNVHFRMGRTGKALLNYERARLFMPRDADLESNMRFVRGRVGVRTDPREMYPRLLRSFARDLTVDELSWIASGIFFVLMVLLSLMVQRPRRGWLMICSVALLSLLMAGNVYAVLRKNVLYGSFAIVVEPRAAVRYGPMEQAGKFFVLNEGDAVYIFHGEGDWFRVAGPDGSAGWVEKRSVSRLREKEVSDVRVQDRDQREKM